MTLCDIDPGTLACKRCGYIARRAKTFRTCTATNGLGDLVAGVLSSVGITKERVSSMLGYDCKCGERQEALNELGRRFGIG